MSLMANPFDYHSLSALHDLQQTATVDLCYLHFDFLRIFTLHRFPWIWEGYFLSRFICGLQHEIMIYVLQHQPSNLLDAYELALIQEYSLAREKTVRITDGATHIDHDVAMHACAPTFQNGSSVEDVSVFSSTADVSVFVDNGVDDNSFVIVDESAPDHISSDSSATTVVATTVPAPSYNLTSSMLKFCESSRLYIAPTLLGVQLQACRGSDIHPCIALWQCAATKHLHYDNFSLYRGIIKTSVVSAFSFDPRIMSIMDCLGRLLECHVPAVTLGLVHTPLFHILTVTYYGKVVCVGYVAVLLQLQVRSYFIICVAIRLLGLLEWPPVTLLPSMALHDYCIAILSTPISGSYHLVGPKKETVVIVHLNSIGVAEGSDFGCIVMIVSFQALAQNLGATLLCMQITKEFWYQKGLLVHVQHIEVQLCIHSFKLPDRVWFKVSFLDFNDDTV